MNFLTRFLQKLTGKKPDSVTPSSQPGQRSPQANPAPAQATVTPTQPVVARYPAISDPWDEPELQVTKPSQTVTPGQTTPATPLSSQAQTVSETLQTWGVSGQAKYIPQLTRYAVSPDAATRHAVAIALGQIAAANRYKPEVQRTIPTLGKLSQDTELQVRQAAVVALGLIQSPKVLPFLKQALNSPTSGVSKAASEAIRKLKLDYGVIQEPKPTVPVKVLRH